MAGRRGYHEHGFYPPHPVRTNHPPTPFVGGDGIGPIGDEIQGSVFEDEPSKRRGRPPKIHKCFKCPPDHEGWRKEQVRTKGGVEYCEEHYPQPRPPAPPCPACGNDFQYFVWHGSVERTTVHCFCSPRGEKGWRALDFFDAVSIKIQASPIE